ncbi:MAG: hypothetical protein CVV19_01780 [Gammaproteobacteria bacterium HGW-Gammaproteobacteria-9]|nr:hypothetical protein [[Pseudomonas] sp. BICA1-14]KJS71936.1 MAG: hypothetical protein JL55_28990 [[Pseudomonas] sp. BICA1-14]PKM00857.1 MAG: hypothetical protein CVV19_01780 [Gammaproteobacteria bacterium HGW-Gammaproteobacteria-9]
MSLTLRQIVRRLNAHHARTSAGFYGDGQLPGRWFRARLVRGTTLEVHDWITWVAVPNSTCFRDHNGRQFLTVIYPPSDTPTAGMPAR